METGKNENKKMWQEMKYQHNGKFKLRLKILNKFDQNCIYLRKCHKLVLFHPEVKSKKIDVYDTKLPRLKIKTRHLKMPGKRKEHR